MNNSSIELEAPMKSTFCTSTYVNGHKKKRPSNIKSRQITMLKNVQITRAKTQFSKCPITQKHDVSENLAPIACIYIYIYICIHSDIAYGDPSDILSDLYSDRQSGILSEILS